MLKYSIYKRYNQNIIREKQTTFCMTIIVEYVSFIILGNIKVRIIQYKKTKTHCIPFINCANQINVIVDI